MTDPFFMELALKLAASVRGRTWPNPMVGAVIVKEGRIVGMGAHLQAGKPHAEVHAFDMADDESVGATLYVTLEPCSHHGRTPPCADRVVASGVKRVVVASLDPNPLVAGRGVARLREAGLEVEVGLLQQQANELNEVFFHYIKTGHPFVTLKTAITLDGKIATASGDSRWITGPESRSYVHQLRDLNQAILVGIGTVLADDPELTVRLPEGGRNPLRIIVDSNLRIPETAKVLDTSLAPTLLVCKEGSDLEKITGFQDRGIEVLTISNSSDEINLQDLLEELGRREIASLLVEGGAKVNRSFLESGLVQKMITFIAPKLVGGDGPTPFKGSGVEKMAHAWELERMETLTFGSDIAIIGYPRRPSQANQN